MLSPFNKFRWACFNELSKDRVLVVLLALRRVAALTGYD